MHQDSRRFGEDAADGGVRQHAYYSCPLYDCMLYALEEVMCFVVMQGYVVGFSGTSLYCLQDAALQTVEAPMSAALQCYLQRQDVDSAYQVPHQIRLSSCSALHGVQL